MELAGLEPATSWVRCGHAQRFRSRSFAGSSVPIRPQPAAHESGSCLQGIVGDVVRADGCADQRRCGPGGRTVLLGA